MGTRREDHSFHRPPRAFPKPVPAEEIVIQAPPQSVSTNLGTMLFVLFPIVGSFGIFAFALVYRNRVFLYVAIAMVLVTALFAIGMRWAQKRSGKKTARRQRRRYREYLAGIESKLGEIAGLKIAAGERLYPDPQRLWGVVLRQEALWERRQSDPDFLELRAGRGPIPHPCQPRVDLGHNPIAEYDQKLVDDATALGERWQTLGHQAVTLSLAETPVISITGPAGRGRALARALLNQLACFRAPSDLRIACAYEPESAESWEWLKWLPHARDDGPEDSSDGGPTIALADSATSLARMLDGLVAPRLEQLRTLSDAAFRAQSPQLNVPHLVLVIDDFSPTDPRSRLPLLREVLLRGAALRVSVIALVGDPADEPAETGARLRISGRGSAWVEETAAGGRSDEITELDQVAVGAAEALARSLAPVRLIDQASQGPLHQELGLLGLLGLRTIDAVEPESEWLPRPRELELRATIGITDAGEPLILDLKQSAEGGMGPHGLVIGATGSGKSELLRTLVASLALTHSPQQLAFVFIDYKGGTALAELERLPHTAGMITNLQSDLSLVDRMHDALYGEQQRREQLLRDAGNVDDVVAYRKARERDPSLPPLPDLLVIIDEFSELLTNRPDFIDLFVAIGRVGRALGIHLLFTSQRFDEGRLRGLESHLRYRVCLRTYSPIESKAVIGTPDAYALPADPGLGYLKVDTGTYERFRTVLVSRPHQDPSEARRGPMVTPFEVGANGRVAELSPADTAGSSGRPSEMQLLVERLAGASPERVHQVWLDPLERLLPLDEVQTGEPWWRDDHRDPAKVDATIGTVDVPREQRKEPLTLDFASGEGHLAVVGAPQSGKSSLLRTLALALAVSNRPDEVEIHAIDLGGGQLRALNGLPHVGTVAAKGERELIAQIIRRVKSMIEERSARFAREGIDSIAERRARRGTEDGDGDPCPDVFLFVDGWAQLRREFEGLDFEIDEISSTGLPYGVHLVITAQRWGEMRPSLSDNLGKRLELRLNDPIESAIGRKAAERVPADAPGRGLLREGLEFQAALPRFDGRPSAEGLGEATDVAARSIAEKWKREGARPVRVLPDDLHAEDLAVGDAATGVPIGLDERFEAVCLDLGGADPHFVVLGDGESGRTNLLRAFVLGLTESGSAEGTEISLVDPRRTLGDLADQPAISDYAASPASIGETAGRLAAEVSRRLAGASAQANGSDRTPDPELYLVIDDYDLIASPEANPLGALAEVLPHGRDAGFHVVLARRAAGATRAAFEPFYRRLIELRSPGVILSGDRAEGPLLDGNRAEHRPPGRGLLVRRGEQPVLMQAVHCPPVGPSREERVMEGSKA